jgi:metal-responsive CopG/Arc/MetJ family transcriptional regulator
MVLIATVITSSSVGARLVLNAVVDSGRVPGYLTEARRHDRHIPQAPLHIHRSPELCLEAIVLRGARNRAAATADRLIGARDILRGRFIQTTTGAELI